MSKSPGLGDLWNIRGERETEGESEIRIKDCLDYCLELVGGSEKERKGRRERYLRGKDSVDMFVMSGLGGVPGEWPAGSGTPGMLFIYQERSKTVSTLYGILGSYEK